MLFFIIFIVASALLFMFSLAKASETKMIVWLLASVVSGILFFICIFFTWKFFETYSSRHRFEFSAPLQVGSVGLAPSTFLIPKGDYEIVVSRNGASLERDFTAKMNYECVIPDEHIQMKHHENLKFNLRIRSIRLAHFSVLQQSSKGLLTASVENPIPADLEIKLIDARILDL